MTLLLLSDVGLLWLECCLSSTLNTLTILCNTLLNIVDLFKIMWLFSRFVQQSSLRPTETGFMSVQKVYYCSHALTAKEWTCAVRNSALFLSIYPVRENKKVGWSRAKRADGNGEIWLSRFFRIRYHNWNEGGNPLCCYYKSMTQLIMGRRIKRENWLHQALLLSSARI